MEGAKRFGLRQRSGALGHAFPKASADLARRNTLKKSSRALSDVHTKPGVKTMQKLFSMNRVASSKWRRVKCKFLAVVSASVAFCATYFVTAQPAPPRQPMGIYVIPDLDECIAHTNHTDECITNNITTLLNNTAISGIAAMVRWNDLSLSYPPGSTNSIVRTNDWSILDDIFGAVENWNSNNLTSTPKTVQLGVIPGFWTPQWVLNNLPSCDPMFATNPPDANLVTNTCGCATFLNSEGASNTNALLPLPWNSYYQNAWQSFIEAVADRYGSNPLLVSVAVAGPTASSEEMILPNLNNDPTNFYKWNPLFALTFPTTYQNSDMAFIMAWEDAIDMYGRAFSNLTLTISTGSGLPNFLMPNSTIPYTNYSVPPGFCPDCAGPYTNAIMDCAAETTILAYFADPQRGGNNAKATQEDGLAANGIYLNPPGSPRSRVLRY